MFDDVSNLLVKAKLAEGHLRIKILRQVNLMIESHIIFERVRDSKTAMAFEVK